MFKFAKNSYISCNFLIKTQYVEPNSGAHQCRFLNFLFYFVSINVYFNVICVEFFAFWQKHYEI